MSTPKPASSGFAKLNAMISIQQGATAAAGVPASTTSPAPPRLILLFTWLGAGGRAITKYTAGLQSLYPNATTYVVASDFYTYATGTRASQRAQLSILVSELQSTDPSTILVLSLSNSGTQKLALLATEYRARTGKPFAAKVTILDSAPGRMSLQSGLNAMSQGLPRNPLLYYPSWLMLYAAGVAAIGFYSVSGVQDEQSWVRAVLNATTEADRQPALTGAVGQRVYVYSDNDSIVSGIDVRSHAEEAKSRGWKVELEKFDGSQHCAHLKADEGRYWDVVRTAWLRSSL